MTSLAQAVYADNSSVVLAKRNEKEAVTKKDMKKESPIGVKTVETKKSATEPGKKDDLKTGDKKDDSSDKKNANNRKGLKKDDDSYGAPKPKKNENKDGKKLLEKLLAEIKAKNEASRKAVVISAPNTDKSQVSANSTVITSDAFRASGFIFTMVSIFIFF